MTHYHYFVVGVEAGWQRLSVHAFIKQVIAVIRDFAGSGGLSAVGRGS
jgi:hypothetical protein